MSRILGTLLALVVLSWALAFEAVQAAGPPEALLSKDSVLYLRYDGMQGHRDAYNKTVVARLMREDLGELFGYLTQLAQDALGPDVLAERLLRGAKPAQLLAIQKATKGIPHVLHYLQNNGFVLGSELIDANKPQMHVTLVLPDAGQDEKTRSGVYGVMRLFGLLGGVDVKQVEHKGRTVLHFEEEPLKVACWREGDHMVITAGTEDVDHTLKLVTGDRPSLATSPALKSLAGFKSYETCLRGTVDVEGITRFIATAFPPARAVAKQLGLADLNDVSFHFGFEGKYQRSTFVLNTTGKRTGLLRLLAPSGAVSLDQLPALPSDATAVYASRMDWSGTFDAVVEAVKGVINVAYPFASADDVDEAIAGFEKSIGLNLRKDFFAALGSGVVAYNAPTQGVMGTGYTLALEVKDEAKLRRSLDTVIKSIASLSGTDMSIKTRKYRGVDLHMVQVAQAGFFFVPSYTIHDGWLAVSLFPQPVQAFVMRSRDKSFSTWKPPELLARALRDAKQGGGNVKITSLSVVDPRPGVDSVLSVAPFFVGVFQSFSQAFGGGGGGNFDISLIPNPKSVSDLIGPSVSVGIDDGKTIRIESVGTLPIPLEMSGFDIYTIFVFSFAIAGAAG